MISGMALLSVKNLNISFGANAPDIVSNVSFEVDSGEILALVGESGCGKSISCLSLTSLLPSPPARIRADAIEFRTKEGVVDLSRLPARKLRKIRGGGIAYIFQEPSVSLNPVFRVGSQIAEVLALHRPEVTDRHAEVVELDSEIKLEPGMTMKQLRQRVVDYERQAFIEQYKPSYLPMGEIVFTTPGSYPEMVNHILVHKYYINQNVKGEISFEDAAKSWYENVYAPIVRQIREDNLMFYFPGNAEGDLYMWLVRRWDEMKKVKKDASIQEASRRLRKESGSSLLRRWVRLIKEKLKRE